MKSNDLVVNKIWARSGSVTVVPNHLTDCYVSGEFPLFELDQDRILPGWAKLLTKWKGFWLACDEKSQGTSGKNRIKPQQFLSVTIPLPNSITEQQTIVARLDAVTEKARQVAARLDATEADAERLLAVRFHETIKEAQ